MPSMFVNVCVGGLSSSLVSVSRRLWRSSLRLVHQSPSPGRFHELLLGILEYQTVWKEGPNSYTVFQRVKKKSKAFTAPTSQSRLFYRFLQVEHGCS